MKFKVITGLMSILFLASTVTITLNVQPVKAEPTTWTVDDDRPADFSTIQEAINTVNPGDAIFVYEGIYYENVVINKSISLIGEDKDQTIIDANKTGIVVHIKANNVTVNNFTIQNSGTDWDHGLLIEGSNNTIRNNILKYNFWRGIMVDHSSDNIITYNTVINTVYDGIAVYYSSGNIVADNTVTKATLFSGIQLFGSISNNITGNTVTSNKGAGIWLRHGGNNTVKKNIARNNGRCGISLDFSDYNEITGNTISNNPEGIYLYICSGNKIYHNNFSNTKQAHSLYSTNIWDDGYPSGGNYWSDYTGIDLFTGLYQNESGSDGIGDTPYIINGTNKDNYPLISPWSPPPLPPVGGIIVPINKLELLIPYIGVISAILVAITVVVKKRRLTH